MSLLTALWDCCQIGKILEYDRCVILEGREHRALSIE